jgi:phosphoglycerate kinase
LPTDVVVAASMEASDDARNVQADQVPADSAIFDIGPETVAAFQRIIENAGTVVWNGPMGVFERSPFDRGTLGVASAVAKSSAFSLVGGGDSVAALNELDLASEIDHVSTGGGASLEYLSGGELPGLAALEKDG